LTLSSKGEGGNLTEGEWPQRGIKGTKSGEGRGDETERAANSCFSWPEFHPCATGLNSHWTQKVEGTYP